MPRQRWLIAHCTVGETKISLSFSTSLVVNLYTSSCLSQRTGNCSKFPPEELWWEWGSDRLILILVLGVPKDGVWLPSWLDIKKVTQSKIQFFKSSVKLFTAGDPEEEEVLTVALLLQLPSRISRASTWVQEIIRLNRHWILTVMKTSLTASSVTCLSQHAQ